MLCVSKLRRHPRHFHSFTGLSVAQFDQLLVEFQPAYEAQRQLQQNNSVRQRQPGAGRPRRLALPECLFMGLVYLRLYLSQRLLSFFFDIDQSTVCRELKDRVMTKQVLSDLPLLFAVLPVPLRDAPLRSEKKPDAPPHSPDKTGGKPRRRINTLQELLATYPELSEVLLDATEQEIPQPEDRQKSIETYRGNQVKRSFTANKVIQ